MMFYSPTEVRQAVALPLFSDRIPCGFPSPAADYFEEYILLNKHFIAHPFATYMMIEETNYV